MGIIVLREGPVGVAYAKIGVTHPFELVTQAKVADVIRGENLDYLFSVFIGCLPKTEAGGYLELWRRPQVLLRGLLLVVWGSW